MKLLISKVTTHAGRVVEELPTEGEFLIRTELPEGTVTLNVTLGGNGGQVDYVQYHHADGRELVFET